MKILILGGYGTFGGRLVRLLAAEPRLTLLVAGRSRAKAQAFADIHACPGGATLRAVQADRAVRLDETLRELEPDLLVDASGPFQAYGKDAHAVVQACLRHGVHYLDLADDSDFVTGIEALDPQARSRGVFALSGASTLPALSFAVVRHVLRAAGRDITPTSIVAGIAPSPFAGVGGNVVRAILSYAGKPVAVMREGGAARATALIDSIRYTIAPPGALPLRRRRFSLVDVPDLRLAARCWPGLQCAWFGAAPAPAVLHRVLSVLAWLVRARVLKNLAPFSRLGHWMCEHMRWGEARGGMFVCVAGSNVDGKIERTWHLAAEGDHGPYIPAMAAAAIVRRCLAGRPPAAGARACTGELELADFEAFFRQRPIHHGVRERRVGDERPLYARILGDSWDVLPPAIRALHGEGGRRAFRGQASVERGRGLGGIIAVAARLPQPTRCTPVHVAFHSEQCGERWERRFGTQPMESFQWEGTGAAEGMLCERFGPARLDMALVESQGRLEFVMRGWRLLGIPMPLLLGPTLRSSEAAEGDHVRFTVEVGHRLTGMIIRYGGLLSVATAAARPAVRQSSVM